MQMAKGWLNISCQMVRRIIAKKNISKHFKTLMMKAVKIKEYSYNSYKKKNHPHKINKKWKVNPTKESAKAIFVNYFWKNEFSENYRTIP